MMLLDEIRQQAKAAMSELVGLSSTRPGDIVIVGCSSSEAAGEKIGTHSSIEVAEAIFEGLYPVVQEHGLYLAAQCCEHLNRALILENEAVGRYGLEQVNVIPQPKAGGSFATTAWKHFNAPAAVEGAELRRGLRHGYRWNADRNASEKGCSSGSSQPFQNRRSDDYLRPYPSEICGRSPRRL